MATRILRAECFVCRAPIAVPVVNAFGSMAERVAVFVRLTDADGVSGLGEIWSNVPTIGAEHRARLFDAFIAPRLLGAILDVLPHALRLLHAEATSH